ncbi:hypothetical protein AARAC_010290, partial [Aspergillus arachidicola]
MYIDTFFPDGVYHALLPRQTYASCWGGLGQGECRGSSNCISSFPLETSILLQNVPKANPPQAKDSSTQINALTTKVTSAVSNAAAQSPKEQVTVETPITKPAMEGLTSPDR